MDFKQCLALTLRFEGGYSNHTADPGGATMCGVTQKVYDSFRTKKGLPAQAVRGISQVEIEEVYKVGYWFPSGASSSSAVLAPVLFDFAVNSGVTQALKTCQSVLGLTCDGVLGPKTVDRLSRATLLDAQRLLDARQAFFDRICQKIPARKVFLAGWTNRVNLLRKAFEP
jgi:lysozyme family protein